MKRYRGKSVVIYGLGQRFRKDYDNNRIIAFDSYRFEEGVEALLRTDAPAYRLLSIHGHPSYLGVL